MNIKKIVVFLLVSLCVSCAYNRIDVAKLQDKNGKYGLVVFRGIVFKSTKLARKFCATGYSDKLRSDNKLSVFVAEPNKDGYFSRDILSWRFDANDREIAGQRFVINSGDKFWKRGTVLDPQFFYGVKMMAEGWYCIRELSAYPEWTDSILREFKKNENKFCFYVNAGQVNYIGDLYMSSIRMKYEGFFEGYKGKAKLFICDRHQDIDAYLKKFFSEIDLPIVTSLIKTKGIKSQQSTIK